jgi:hypothetical protein
MKAKIYDIYGFINHFEKTKSYASGFSRNMSVLQGMGDSYLTRRVSLIDSSYGIRGGKRR